MTHSLALEQIAGHVAHARLIWLCSDDNPDEWTRTSYRAHVVELASGAFKSAQLPPAADPSVPVGPCCGGAFNPYAR
jgi:hypothetical protein